MGQKTAAQLVELLRRERVLDMPALRSAFPGRSQRGIMRDLAAVGYRTSCNLHGRFYALDDVPEFDGDGLWRHGHVLFSRQGTLKATVRHLVEAADDGRTHGELQERLRLRVYDTLLDLVQKGEIAREALDQLFLYISADLQIGSAQLRRRRAQMTPADFGHVGRLFRALPAAPVLPPPVLPLALSHKGSGPGRSLHARWPRTTEMAGRSGPNPA